MKFSDKTKHRHCQLTQNKSKKSLYLAKISHFSIQNYKISNTNQVWKMFEFKYSRYSSSSTANIWKAWQSNSSSIFKYSEYFKLRSSTCRCLLPSILQLISLVWQENQARLQIRKMQSVEMKFKKLILLYDHKCLANKTKNFADTFCFPV